MNTWTNTRLLAVGTMVCGLGIIFGMGATLMLAAPNGEAKKKEAPAVKTIVDDYKKHYDAFVKAEYKAEIWEGKYTLVSDNENPIARGIMGTWVSDKPLTQATGNPPAGNAIMTFAPTDKPSKGLLDEVAERLGLIQSKAERNAEPEKSRFQAMHDNLKEGMKTIYRWGSIKVANRDVEGRDVSGHFVLASIGGVPTVFVSRNEEGKGVTDMIISYTHTKDGVLDSLVFGDQTYMKIGFVRASAEEKIAEIRSTKPEERKEDSREEEPREKSAAPREEKTIDREKTGRR